SSLALPTGEGHAPSMDMQRPQACSEPLSSHGERGLVSRRLLGLPAACHSLPSRPRAGGPAAASACFYLGLVLATSPARHGFCFLSLAETEKPRQDALCVLRAGRSHGRLPPQRGIRMATPLCHTPSGTIEAHCPWRSVRVDHPWSPR